MVAVSKTLLGFLLIAVTAAEAPDPPLSETRLTISTLVREDIFAGLLENDMQHLARAERNIQLLLQQRPESGWQASTVLYRAVLAHENKRTAEYSEQYQRALALFEEAHSLAAENVAVAAVTSGSFVLLATAYRQGIKLMHRQGCTALISTPEKPGAGR